MDYTTLLSFPGVLDSARMQSRDRASAEALKQAQIAEMVQKAKLAEQMAPTEIAFKEAMASDYLARANGTGNYEKVPDPYKEARAEESARLARILADSAKLAHFPVLDDSNVKAFRETLPTLSPEIQVVFTGGIPGRVEASQKHLEAAKNLINSQHPYLNKVVTRGMQEAGDTERTKLTNASREAIARVKADVDKSIAKLKASKNSDGLKTLWEKLLNEAVHSENKEERASLIGYANQALQAKHELEQARAGTPKAGSIDISKAGKLPAATPPKLETNLKPEDTSANTGKDKIGKNQLELRRMFGGQ